MTVTEPQTAADGKAVEALAGELADALLNQYLTIGQIHGLGEADYEAVYNLGYNQYNQGKFKDATQSFAFLAFHNHLEPRFHKALGSSLQMLGQYERAIAAYATAIVLDALDPEPMLRMGECLIGLGNVADAVEVLEGVRQICAETRKHGAIDERAQALLQVLGEALERKGASR